MTEAGREISECQTCSELFRKKDKIFSAENKFLFLHAPSVLINLPNEKLLPEKKSDRKVDRDTLVLKLKKYISALRNSGGGVILLHICDLDREDKYLDHFHELVDVKFNQIIEDGSLFIQVYKKNWLYCLADCSDDEGESGDDTDEDSTEEATDYNLYRDVVGVTVVPSFSVATVNFKTKLPLDNGVVDPVNTEIVQFLKWKTLFQNVTAQIRNLDNLDRLHESRCMQFKSVQPDGAGADATGNILNNPERLNLFQRRVSKK
ncbi:uncharacterized protein LOC124264968 [Haliotis rubra]|uniref:uncharacterized protein LOC124264968 n=1 Tax=Haliotis rubra TaxID=36100 RepID=UPI001EE550EA|nr:uncharacterized protein LOC124264968 [Haliotis rubra]